MVELLHVERSRAEQLKKKAGPSKGPANSAALFDDPLIYIRKWMGEVSNLLKLNLISCWVF